jgi:hypothetical protein
MTSFSPSATKIRDVRYFRWSVYENLYPLSTGDKVVCRDFISSVVLSQAVLVNNADGSLVACSVALNVVTVSGVVDGAECTLFVFGRRKN